MTVAVVREVQAVARTNLDHRRARPGQQSVSMPGGTATLGLRTEPQFRLLPITYIMSYQGARIASDAVFASLPVPRCGSGADALPRWVFSSGLNCGDVVVGVVGSWWCEWARQGVLPRPKRARLKPQR